MPLMHVAKGGRVRISTPPRIRTWELGWDLKPEAPVSYLLLDTSDRRTLRITIRPDQFDELYSYLGKHICDVPLLTVIYSLAWVDKRYAIVNLTPEIYAMLDDEKHPREFSYLDRHRALQHVSDLSRGGN